METYNLSDFPQGILEDQFKAEIAASTISQQCNDVSRSGNTINMFFAANLTDPEREILSTLIAAHLPPPPKTILEPYTIPGSSLVRQQIGSTIVTYVGSQTGEIHISKEPQAHFSTIKAAIAANPGQNKVFIVHPGDYIEDNPINLDVGTVLISCGNAENTFITAQNPVSTVLNISVKCKIEGFTFRGGSTGVFFNQTLSGGYGRYSAMTQCFVVNCGIGIDCNAYNIHLAGGMADTLYCREIVISSTTRPLSKGVYVHAGGQFISAGVTVFGVPPMGPNPAVPIMCGYYCADSVSKIAMSVTNCYFCGVGLYLDGGSSSEMTLLTIKYNANGVIIGPVGTTTRFSVNSLEIAGCTAKDFTVLATDAQIEVHSGIFDDTKILNANGVRLNMKYHTNKNGKTRQRMLGIINIGTPTETAKVFIGQGSYDVYSLVVLRNTNGESGTWSDVTADALEESGNPFGLFAGADPNNCLYIGRDQVPVGFKLNVATATTSTVPLSDLIYEYWNGSAWVEFYIMQTYDTEPFYYVGDSCISAVGSYHVRFGLKSNAPLVAKTINDVTKKWIRVRVVNALPSIPTSDYILAHTSVTKIGSDGYTEYYGDARVVKKLSWNLYDMATTGGIDQKVYYGKKIYSGGIGNYFQPGINCTLSLSAFVPTDMDNSFPAKIILIVLGSDTGNATLTFRYDFSNTGSPLYLTVEDAPAASPHEMTVTTTVTITAGVESRVEAMIPACHVNMNPSGQGPQSLWLSVEHASTDTYAGSLTLTQISGYYVSWIEGAHLIAY